MDYPIPHQSRIAFERHQDKIQGPQNAGLIFDRFAPDWSQEAKLKKEGLETVRKAAINADEKLLTAWCSRWEAAANEVRAKSFPLKTDWRLIAGLGRKGSLEVGFTFNRYGFPIIPGSSLKGLARAWAFFQIAEKLVVPPKLWPQLEKALQGEWDNKEDKWQDWARQRAAEIEQSEVWQSLEEALQKQGDEGKKQQREKLDALLKAIGGDEPAQWRAIFGTTDEAGKVIFLDAIPTQLPKLELEIMNPHYPDYYGDATYKTPPTDWQSPRPVYFLTIAPNTEFCFAVGWRGATVNELLRQVAEEWLKAGLTELGVGSKTSAGYGYFREETEAAVHPVTTPSIKQAAPPHEPLSPTPVQIWRKGTIVGSIDTSKTRRGKVEDAETKQVYEFHTSAIQGDTPGKAKPVEFVLQDGKVVAVRRK